MIRGLLVGIARIVLAAIAFYLVAAAVRAVVRVMTRRRQPPTVDNPPQPPARPAEPYTDVQDASFTDLPRGPSSGQ